MDKFTKTKQLLENKISDLKEDLEQIRRQDLEAGRITDKESQKTKVFYLSEVIETPNGKIVRFPDMPISTSAKEVNLAFLDYRLKRMELLGKNPNQKRVRKLQSYFVELIGYGRKRFVKEEKPKTQFELKRYKDKRRTRTASMQVAEYQKKRHEKYAQKLSSSIDFGNTSPSSREYKIAELNFDSELKRNYQGVWRFKNKK